jgi:hypothetical protein
MMMMVKQIIILSLLFYYLFIAEKLFNASGTNRSDRSKNRAELEDDERGIVNGYLTIE